MANGFDPFGKLAQARLQMNQLEQQKRRDAEMAQMNALRRQLLEKQINAPPEQDFTIKEFGAEGDKPAGLYRLNPSTGERVYLGPAAEKTPQTQITFGGKEQTKGRTKLDETFAKEYSDYVATGGYSSTVKNLSQLESALGTLQSGKNVTGPLIGMTPDPLLAIFNPEAKDTKEAVEEVVQRNLRDVLGPQFTEKEGTRLIERAYNPSLSERTNAMRLRRLISQIRQAAQAKASAARYFEENGTLTGWQGKLPTMEDFSSMTFGASPEKQGGQEVQGGGQQREVVRRGTYNGRSVVQYSDGTIEYADN